MTKQELADWTVSAQLRPCTAAVDHCFTKDIWLMEPDERSLSTRYVYPVRFGPTDPNEGGWYSPERARPATPSLAHRTEFTAYRTVPATKRNLVDHVLVVVMSFPTEHPTSAMAALETAYRIGELDRVDPAEGFIYLAGVEDPFWLSSARVCVLSWRVGEKVKVLRGAKRDQLAVGAKDVYLPKP
jgi:hypothetical protein